MFLKLINQHTILTPISFGKEGHNRGDTSVAGQLDVVRVLTWPPSDMSSNNKLCDHVVNL